MIKNIILLLVDRWKDKLRDKDEGRESEPGCRVYSNKERIGLIVHFWDKNSLIPQATMLEI